MKTNYKAVIVGGGASGLMCAVELLRSSNSINGSEVLIIEKNDRVGKKLLATGNGQGNVCNANFSSEFYHGKKDFIKSFMQSAKDINIVEYLSALGIPLITAKDGKQYPVSKQANAVLDVLRAFLQNKGCSVLTNVKVEKIKKEEQGFIVCTDNGVFNAQNVVLAFGGAAGKQFGTDGSSYSLAQNFGHKITELYPSLVQLKTRLDNIRGLKGLKENARVSALDNQTVLSQSVGDILFTDYGISGNTVFGISGYLAKAKRPIVKIEFLPDFTQKEVEDMLEARLSLDYISSQDILVGIVNKRIGQAVLKICKQLTAKTIANALKNFCLEVTGNTGFNNAQVTKGGIDTDNVNPLTMQSKLQKGLYIIGEALDVDGDCGGYNLAFAFVSAILCAKNIKLS